MYSTAHKYKKKKSYWRWVIIIANILIARFCLPGQTSEIMELVKKSSNNFNWIIPNAGLSNQFTYALILCLSCFRDRSIRFNTWFKDLRAPIRAQLVLARITRIGEPGIRPSRNPAEEMVVGRGNRWNMRMDWRELERCRNGGYGERGYEVAPSEVTEESHRKRHGEEAELSLAASLSPNRRDSLRVLFGEFNKFWTGSRRLFSLLTFSTYWCVLVKKTRPNVRVLIFFINFFYNHFI